MRKNYLEIVELLTKICLAHPLVNDVHYGNYQSQERENISYGAVILTPGTIGTTVNTITYGFTLTYVDRLKTDERNEIEIQSCGIDVIRGIVSAISAHGSMLLDYHDPIEVNVFSRQSGDNVAGAMASVSLETTSNIGECTWFRYCDECTET